MATPVTQEEFQQLCDQVHQLTDLLRKQAEYQQALAAFAAPLPARSDSRLYTRQEAADELCASLTVFDDARRELKIRPAEMRGRRPLFSQQQVDRIRENLAKDD